MDAGTSVRAPAAIAANIIARPAVIKRMIPAVRFLGTKNKLGFPKSANKR